MTVPTAASRQTEADPRRFTMFRYDDAPSHAATDVESVQDFPAGSEEYFQRRAEAGASDAFISRLLFRQAGDSPMNALYIYAKPAHILARHSHDTDCLYLVISGEAYLGNQVLGPGDGFYVPAGHPYTYRAGEEGVEVIEFRTARSFSTTFRQESVEVRERMVAHAAAHRDVWRSETVGPLGRVPRSSPTASSDTGR